MPIEIEHPTPVGIFVAVRAVAAQYKPTAYDASYLELAIRHKLRLASFDKALAKASPETGVMLVEL